MLGVVAPPPIPVGKIKSFGAFGPKYEVGRALRPLDDGDWLVEVKTARLGRAPLQGTESRAVELSAWRA
jgi:hypothetical protein